MCKDQGISSIKFSGKKIGQIAAEKLFKQIKSGKIEQETIIIPTKFIIKASSMRT